jgi:phosphatidylserine decarboxylase
MKVDTVRHPRLGDREWVRIATFLSPLDVHINRTPIAGKVIDRWDEPGGFMPAFQDESEKNASRYIVVEGIHGPVAVAQRAGFLARRIITWPKRGELLAQGERYGLIRFGSRTDILFPADQVEVIVRAGDKLAAGQTIVARYL